MITCGFSSHAEGPCGSSLDNPANTECVIIRTCNKDIRAHKTHLGIKDSALQTESQLLLARVGIFVCTEEFLSLTVCPRHRDSYGIRYRCHKTLCSVPATFASHGKKEKVDKASITLLQSEQFFKQTGHLVPVGSRICRRCRGELSFFPGSLPRAGTPLDVTTSSELLIEKTHHGEGGNRSLSNVPAVSSTSTTKSSFEDEPAAEELQSGGSNDSLTEAIGHLTLEDPTFILSDDLSTPSSSSDVDETDVRLQKLNELLLLCGHSDVRIGKPKKKWYDLGERARNVNVQKAGTAISSVVEVISPEDAGSLWRTVLASQEVEHRLGVKSGVDTKYLEALAETYRNAESWSARRQILAIMADLVPLAQLRSFIPGLTEYRYSIARRHIIEHGRGAAVPKRSINRVRIDDSRLDHFLSFITSPHVIQDLPYGQRHLRLMDGRVLETPNVIRCLIPIRIYKQYQQYCEESALIPFSESTVRRLLTVCSASVRRSLQGLDYIAADGAKSFDDLVDIVGQLEDTSIHCSVAWVTDSKRRLKAGKHYIKTDYKVHVTASSLVADHCITHALSDTSDPLLASACDHPHDLLCASCEDLKGVLMKIESAITSASTLQPDVRDDIMFAYSLSCTAIDAWKAHQLRSIQQDKPRHMTLEEMGPDEILVFQDWAMKFLPQKYRETQADWFGKRGISWHISVVIRRNADGSLRHQAFVHIVENCSQDSSVVVSIMRHTLATVKSECPELTTAYYRQDNAGCYHSASMIAACRSLSLLTGIKVQRVDFSDPQGGKAACDRKASTIKAHIRRYINEGHDVVTPSDLRTAMLSCGGIPGVRVALVDASILSPVLSPRIPNISSMNNFVVGADELTMWKAFDVGVGKTFSWTQLKG
ncbi:uncharacterized protein LOC116611598 [Nematostella vectensis]|uniref:uncharacterized protein LOC116611598 n=1 Tax=Nematostella vectensis TaxID=45351 RepID=UPI0020777865|nr:uncharacterized protein LOC116611598 [Nematostella vectensis]